MWWSLIYQDVVVHQIPESSVRSKLVHVLSLALELGVQLINLFFVFNIFDLFLKPFNALLAVQLNLVSNGVWFKAFKSFEQNKILDVFKDMLVDVL
jgi:hypothetical protein